MERGTRIRFNHQPFIISVILLFFIGTFTYGSGMEMQEDVSSEALTKKESTIKQKTSDVNENRFVKDEEPLKRIGYYAGWSAYSGFHVTDIDAGKLTHVNYAFANISKDGKIDIGDPWVDPDNFDQLQKMKRKHPHLKTLISVGGWTWSENFSDVALTEESRTIFAESVLDFIQRYGFDGVDLDWEYPVSGGQPDNINRPEDKENYTLLLKKIRETLDAHGGEEYFLTIASGASPYHAANLELAKIHQYVDYIQLMTYDIHGEWDELTGMNAPLRKDPASGFYKEWSVQDSVETFITQGVPVDKIVMGLPFYGRMFKQAAAGNDGLYQPFTGGGRSVSYAELEKDFINKNGFTRHWEEDSEVPWLTDGSTFISYDDVESFSHKTDYIKEKRLGGAMVWELSQDPDGVLLNKVYRDLKE